MFDCVKVELLQEYFRYTLNIMHLKTDIIQRSYNPYLCVILNHILGILLRNVHCAIK